MNIQLLGAARTVTGSCYLIEAGGHRFALDCGLHQGNRDIEGRNWNTAVYDPGAIEFFLVTHAHMDHSGLLPRMVQAGFRGRIYTTPPTGELLQVMLLDSAHIQEMEALWQSRKRLRHGEKRVVPLYTQRDAENTFSHFETVPYDRPFEPFPGLRVTFRDAGHILGAAMVVLEIEEGGKPMKIVFSGDIGRPAQLMMSDPSVITRADFLFLESTYGNRNHKNEEESLDELAQAIAYSSEHGEKVIIPAFAVERTQEILYCLHQLAKGGRLPRGLPVYVDSPLAIRATEIFNRNTAYFDQETREMLRRGENPLTVPNLHLTETTEESMAINTREGPAVVISASGMADAGRIKHHLRHNLWREGASVVFVGFQAQGTTGRRIVDGAAKVRLFGEDVAVRAKVFTINGFSAHAGQSQILDWLSHFETAGLEIFLVHGEYGAQQALAEKIRERFGIRARIPDYLEEVTLVPGKEVAARLSVEAAMPRVDWEKMVADLEATVARLRVSRPVLEAADWGEQTDLRDRLTELNRALDAALPGR
jgi:metallo-beta-lactamase family protein